MHGAFLESHPDGASHPRYGTPYDWSGIVKSLTDRGFYVFSEIRPQGTRPPQYAAKIAQQVKRLLNKGVPANRIIVSGHSKGGAISLFAATLIANPEIGVINMAGCGSTDRFARNFRRFVRNKGTEVTGRLLSIYDADDNIAGSCAAIRDAGASVKFSEIVLRTGKGHQLFYGPNSVWVDEIEKFVKKTS